MGDLGGGMYICKADQQCQTGSKGGGGGYGTWDGGVMAVDNGMGHQMDGGMMNQSRDGGMMNQMGDGGMMNQMGSGMMDPMANGGQMLNQMGDGRGMMNQMGGQGGMMNQMGDGRSA